MKSFGRVGSVLLTSLGVIGWITNIGLTVYLVYISWLTATGWVGIILASVLALIYIWVYISWLTATGWVGFILASALSPLILIFPIVFWIVEGWFPWWWLGTAGIALAGMWLGAIFVSRGRAMWVAKQSGSAPEKDKDIELRSLERAEAYYNRGCLNFKHGKHSDAIKDYDQAMETSPQYAEAYNRRGLAKVKLDHCRGLEGAINYDKASGYPYDGTLFWEREPGPGPEDAIKDYDRAIELNPEYPEAYYNRGCLKFKHGKQADAIKDYTKAIKLSLEYAEVYYNRGCLKIEHGKHSDAIKDYDKAIALSLEYAEVYCARGCSKFKLGRHAGAIKDYDKAIELNPEYSWAYINRGLAKSKLGKYEEANDDYAKAGVLNSQLFKF